MKKTFQVVLILTGGILLGSLATHGAAKIKNKKCSCNASPEDKKMIADIMPETFSVYSNADKSEGVNYFKEGSKYYKVPFGPLMRASKTEITIEEYTAAYEKFLA